MTTRTFQQHILDEGACQRAVDWVGDRSFTRVWKECPYGAWMVWYLWQLNNCGLIDEELVFTAENALRNTSTGLSPAERVRAVTCTRSLAHFSGIFQRI